MAFERHLLTDQAGSQETWIADRRLWVTADRLVAVEDGDQRARFLLCVPGDPIPRAEVEQLGLLKEQDKPEDKMRAPAEDKSKKKPKKKAKKKR